MRLLARSILRARRIGVIAALIGSAVSAVNGGAGGCSERCASPIASAIRSTRAVDFVASLVRFRYSLPGCLPPCTDQTGILPQPPRTFTSRLSTDRSSSPLLDITTTATGLLCWRDSHPLEWQLASLHGQFLPKFDVCGRSPFHPIRDQIAGVRSSDNCAQQFSDTGGESHRQRAPEYDSGCAAQNVCTAYSRPNRAEKSEKAQ